MSTIQLPFGNKQNWHSGLSRVCKISQSQLVNSLLATHPFEILQSGFSRILNIFQSQLVNSQKRRTISQNQSLKTKIRGLKKKTQKKQCQLFNCLLATHPFENLHSGLSRVCRISQIQLVNSLLATHPFEILHSGF